MSSDISVIMTVRNGRMFIKRSIESILNQTLSPKEVVIVDDGSTDDTCKLIEELALNTLISIVLIRTSGVGRSKALCLAVEKCSYEWVANLDVDDYWLPYKLEKQDEIISNEKNVQVIVTQCYLLHENEVDNFIVDKTPKELSYKRLDKKDFYAKNPVNHSSVIFRKSLYKSVGGYNCELKKQIDYDLWAKFILNSVVFYQVNSSLTVKYLHSKQSFEAKNVFSYRVNSFFMKISLLKKVDAPWYFYFKLLLLSIIGFTPRKIKKGIRHLNEQLRSKL